MQEEGEDELEVMWEWRGEEGRRRGREEVEAGEGVGEDAEEGREGEER